MKRCFLLLALIALVCLPLGRAEEARAGAVLVTGAPEVPGLPLEGLKIGIDPGHQAHANNEREPVSPGGTETKAKVSSGTRGVSTRVYEYVVNLDVSLMLKDALEQLGAQVLLTRETHDVDISNLQRAEMMNEWGADLVLRIHCNGSENQSANGLGMYVRKTGACAEESFLLGETLLASVGETAHVSRNGVYKRDTYTGLNWAQMPSVLVEMGYMSNPEEDEKLNDPAYQALLVEGMAKGLCQYAALAPAGAQ